MMTSGAATPAARYNVAILGARAEVEANALKRTLGRRLSELSPDLATAVAYMDGPQTVARNPKMPIVGVYFGSDSDKDADVDAVRSLVSSSAPVVPVVLDLNIYSSSVPTELEGINGSSQVSTDPDHLTIVNVVLENLGLLRRSRRLFVSYHRSESRTEALQIHNELDGRGYDVFLDTHSVQKADDFQRVLWQRLADSDVAVVLDTPDFLASRWTREEIAQAEAMTIGLIQLIWPGQSPVPYSVLCEPFYLEKGDFASAAGGLQDETILRIALEVEKLRARSLAARHDNLVREFCDAAATVGVVATVQPERFITATLKSGAIVAIPAVGVPDAMRYHEASRRFLGGANPPTSVLILYDHRGLRPEWNEFLSWLDDFLPVKAVSITTVASRIGGM
jgi:hypothetical protein